MRLLLCNRKAYLCHITSLTRIKPETLVYIMRSTSPKVVMSVIGYPWTNVKILVLSRMKSKRLLLQKHTTATQMDAYTAVQKLIRVKPFAMFP